jgi:hypothetical protein
MSYLSFWRGDSRGRAARWGEWLIGEMWGSVGANDREVSNSVGASRVGNPAISPAGRR